MRLDVGHHGVADLLGEDTGDVGARVRLTPVLRVLPVVEAVIVLHVAVLRSEYFLPHLVVGCSLLTEIAGNVRLVTVVVLPPSVLVAVNLDTELAPVVAVLPVVVLPGDSVCPGEGCTGGGSLGSYPDVLSSSKLSIDELLHGPGLNGGEVTSSCVTFVSSNLPRPDVGLVAESVQGALEAVPVHRHCSRGGPSRGGRCGSNGVDGNWVFHKDVTNVTDILHLLSDVIQILRSSLGGSHGF